MNQGTFSDYHDVNDGYVLYIPVYCGYWIISRDVSGIFTMTDYPLDYSDSHVGSPTQSCLIIIALTVPYQQKILLVVALFLGQIKVVFFMKKTQSIFIIQKI